MELVKIGKILSNKVLVVLNEYKNMNANQLWGANLQSLIMEKKFFLRTLQKIYKSPFLSGIKNPGNFLTP